MKIKYRVIIEDADNHEYIILLEDGGITATHSTGEYILMTYYQNRITNDSNPDTIWDDLGNGKAYNNEFPYDTDVSELIEDALSWLFVSSDSSNVFERDDSIWKLFFNQ